MAKNRKSKTLRRLLANPLGREIVANALTAGAGAAAAALVRHRDDIGAAATRSGRRGSSAKRWRTAPTR